LESGALNRQILAEKDAGLTMSVDSTWPRITVITPSYNQGEFIEETIKSILNQNYPNLEYFIVDGGSTDNTLEIIRRYEDRIDWWVSEPDRGQSHAINKGLGQATGEIINWINSDDVLFPGALSRIAAGYRQHAGEAALISGALARISQEGRILQISSPPSPRAISFKNLVMPLGQPSSFFTQKAIESVGYLREDLHAIMDVNLYYRIFKAGGKFIKVPGPIGAIRHHGQTKTFSQQELWTNERPKFRNEIGFVPLLHKIDLVKMRLIRLIDGSYFNSYLLTKHYSKAIVDGNGIRENEQNI
jgi:glycosyltransferase involved in cell wall biosynthesis